MKNNQQNTIIRSESQIPSLSEELFKPLRANEADSVRITRPAVSYFKDAMLRLRRNKVAMAACTCISIVALSGFIGPFFFPVDENGTPYDHQQNSDAVSQDPSFGYPLLVTGDNELAADGLIKENFNTSAPLVNVDNLKPPAGLTTVGQGTVNGVTLQWQPVEGVSGYQIFRASAKGGSEKDYLKVVQEDPSQRGVILGKIETPAQYTFTDSAGLDPSEGYVYSVVSYITNPETMDEVLSEQAASIASAVVRTIRIGDALGITKTAEVGKIIQGRSHIFGTDNLGRDIFARTLAGTRIAFLIALVGPFCTIAFGVVYGAISGLMGGKVDELMMRGVEIWDAVPGLLVIILLMLVLGPSVPTLLFTLIITYWLGAARIVRGEVLRLREIEFVHASRLLGAPLGRIVLRHITPNLFGIIIIMWSTMIPNMIQAEAFLAFLGVGIQSPAASWGNVLLEAGGRIQASPMQFLAPASVIGISLLSFFLLGDALRDAFDPKLRGRE